MISEQAKKNAGYLSILQVLRQLFKQGIITRKEYLNAKEFYARLTGADIVSVG
jgi:hypothetical protein